MLEKLSYSRKNLQDVLGLCAGYKDNPTEVIEVISCGGISGPGVLILQISPIE